MTVRQILKMGDERLLRKAQAITAFNTPELLAGIVDMKETMVAANGAEAVELYTQHNAEIAVVLTDMMMPVMDGPATIQVLMRMNPKVRIIAASGLSVKDMVTRAANAGVTHFIPKPYTAETLLKMLHTVLNTKRTTSL